jgi:hypothetical protein
MDLAGRRAAGETGGKLPVKLEASVYYNVLRQMGVGTW